MEERLAVIQRRAVERGKAFGPPLTEADVRGFETHHRVELPDGYRRFLIAVGNGGAGPPIDGLMRLGEVPTGLPEAYARDWRALLHITDPFPFTSGCTWEGPDIDPARANAARHGTLNLGHDGCGLYWLLVVTGSQRGQVWAYADVGVCPQEPGRDFLQWVEAWLDGAPWWAE